MPRPILLTVSRAALSHNLDTVYKYLNNGGTTPSFNSPSVWAVIKANAYGHGIEHAVVAFNRADGLAMLDIEEAIRCRQAGWQGPILLLEGFFEPADLPVLAEYNITAAIHCNAQLSMLEQAVLAKPINIFLKLNTGMNRLGYMPSEYKEAWQYASRLQQANKIDVLGKMTHFSRADDDLEVTMQQKQLFLDVTKNMPGPISICNSAATLNQQVWANIDPELKQWVRPGICLYGSSPFADRSAASLGLTGAQTLSAKLLSTREVPDGSSIGYGHQFTASGTTRMGVVACGYADGYPRMAGTGTPITVAGVRTRVLGRVSMDMLVADLTNIPHAQAGSEVILWGDGGPSIDEVAACAQTIGYELMCAVTPRVPRRIV